MPWEKSYNEADVLERAMHAFWRRGYEATSLSDLVKATGINRGSIYAAYNNKHTLFMHALRHYDQIHRADFLAKITADYPHKQAIIVAFEEAARNTGSSETPPGCLLVNSVLELSPHDVEVREFVDDRLRKVEDFFFDRIQAAVRDQSISANISPRTTAQALLGLFLGLRVLTRSAHRPDVTKAITSQARMMLEV